MTNYPRLGSKVKYFRMNDKGEVSGGKGIVKAYFLSPELREMAQVEDCAAEIAEGDKANVFNIDLFCINASAADKARYVGMMQRVLHLQSTGNDIVKDTVEEYNGLVSVEYEIVLGDPVKYGG